jgi:hypothetical protein
MKTLIRILAITLLPFIIISCDPCLGEGDACADSFNFRVVNKVNGDDLVFGPNPVYRPDSVYLITTLPGYLGAMSSSDGTKFRSNLLIPLDTFYLHLNSADTDTLLMSYDFVKSRCCKSNRGYGKVTGIKYNGVAAKKKGDVFVFEK